MNLFRNVGTGVYQLFELPIEGFIQGGIIQGFKGFGLGCGSLVKGVISGSTNSISRVTGVAASSLASISMDRDYINRREKRLIQKPKNIIYG